jgi:hypothetical protein
VAPALVTRAVPLDRYEEAVAQQPDDVKSVIGFAEIGD